MVNKRTIAVGNVGVSITLEVATPHQLLEKKQLLEQRQQQCLLSEKKNKQITGIVDMMSLTDSLPVIQPINRPINKHLLPPNRVIS